MARNDSSIPTIPAPPISDSAIWSELRGEGFAASAPEQGVVLYGDDRITLPPPPCVPRFE